jgi:hypothetical protein
MSNSLVLVGDRKTAIREYAKSLAKIDKRLSFDELADTMGIERRSQEAHQANSVYCSSRNAESVAYLEKARSLGLTMDTIRETTDKETGKVKAIAMTWNVAKTPKVKVPKLKNEDILKALGGLPKAELEALLAKLS